MKHLLGSALALILVLTSCSKEDITTTDETTNTVSIKQAQSLRVFYDNGADPGQDGVDYGCKGSGGNCLDDVVVSAIASPEIIGNLVDTVGSGNVEGTQHVFEAHAQELSRFIPGELIEGVIKGSLYVKSRGNLDKEQTVYLNFNDRRGKTVSIIPLKG